MYHVDPNAPVQGLGCTSSNFSNKTCALVPTTQCYTYTVQEAMWTLADKKSAIGACAVAKEMQILLRFYCFLAIY